MAIVRDSVSGANQVSSTSVTWSHTCSGSNRLLVVSCGAPTSDTITGVTYNGVSMTLVNKINGGGGDSRWMYLFYLLAPATGANDIVVSSSGTQILFGLGVSYTGVKQSAQPDSSATLNSPDDTLTLSPSTTTVADNSWIVCAVRNDDASFTASVGTINHAGGSSAYLWDSNGPITPAGSSGVTFTASVATGAWASVMASFAPMPDVSSANMFAVF